VQRTPWAPRSIQSRARASRYRHGMAVERDGGEVADEARQLAPISEKCSAAEAERDRLRAVVCKLVAAAGLAIRGTEGEGAEVTDG
jgi:hypothetical protein